MTPGRRGAAALALRIRQARLADAAAIARLMSAAIRVLAARHHPPRVLAAWSSLPPLYHAWAMTAGGEAYLVALRAGRMAGYAARRGREVTAVFVRPAEARRGVGTALLRRLEADARRAGIRTLFVRAAPGAVPFYAAAGFRGGRRVSVPLPGGTALLARALVKPLAAARGAGRRSRSLR